MNLIARMILYLPRMLVDQMVYVLKDDPDLNKLQNDIVWGITVAITLIIMMIVLSLA